MTAPRRRKRYRVIRLADGEVWDLPSAHLVALHMWGRLFKKYAIYKDGSRFRYRGSGDLTEFEQLLRSYKPKVKS